MKHLTEEEMIEQAYGEGAGGAAQHLEECVECARGYTELKNDLGEVCREEPPFRDDNYGERVWSAISGSLRAYPAPRRGWLGIGITPGLMRGMMRGLGYAAICALLAAGAFYAGRNWDHWRTRPITAGAKHPETKQPIVVVVLGDHLDRSERLLVELKHVDAGNADMMPPLRDEARSLLSANRVCRKKAEESGDPALEGALDRLDHLLTEMANQPGGLNPAAITHLKDEMNSDGLLFEVRVLRSRAREQKPTSENHLNGGTA